MRDWNDIVSKELQEEERKQLRKQLESETKNHFPKKIKILFYTSIKETDENLNNDFTNNKKEEIEKLENTNSEIIDKKDEIFLEEFDEDEEVEKLKR